MLLFAYLGLHSRPMSDDYCHIPTAARLNILEYILYWRATIDGSYSDYALRSLLAPVGINITRFFPAILLGAWFLSSAALIAKCLRQLSLQRHRRVIALILSALLVAAISSALYSKMALYWYAASVKYSFPMVLLTLLLLLLLQTAEGPVDGRRHRLLTAAGALLCFACAGFAETLAIVMLIGMSALIGALWFLRGAIVAAGPGDPCRRLAGDGPQHAAHGHGAGRG